MSDARARIILTMARLIEKQGYHATGVNEIIQESGAPKGSLYYYFPGGKEQIGVEAVLESGRIISTRLSGILEQLPDPAEAVSNFLARMADSVESSKFGLGSPLTTASVETALSSEAINKACREAFEQILSAFKDKFLQTGYTETQASELAMLVTTMVEGGILMSRTYHHAGPLRLAGKHLETYLKSLSPSS